MRKLTRFQRNVAVAAGIWLLGFWALVMAAGWLRPDPSFIWFLLILLSTIIGLVLATVLHVPVQALRRRFSWRTLLPLGAVALAIALAFAAGYGRPTRAKVAFWLHRQEFAQAARAAPAYFHSDSPYNSRLPPAPLYSDATVFGAAGARGLVSLVVEFDMWPGSQSLFYVDSDDAAALKQECAGGKADRLAPQWYVCILEGLNPPFY
jgi:hypothetical protein